MLVSVTTGTTGYRGNYSQGAGSCKSFVGCKNHSQKSWQKTFCYTARPFVRRQRQFPGQVPPSFCALHPSRQALLLQYRKIVTNSVRPLQAETLEDPWRANGLCMRVCCAVWCRALSLLLLSAQECDIVCVRVTRTRTYTYKIRGVSACRLAAVLLHELGSCVGCAKRAADRAPHVRAVHARWPANLRVPRVLARGGVGPCVFAGAPMPCAYAYAPIYATARLPRHVHSPHARRGWHRV